MIPHMVAFLAAARGVALPALDPPLNVRLPPPRDAERAGRNVLGNRGSGADVGTLPDAHRRDQLRVAADECFVFDDRFMLLPAVVVAGNGPGPDIDAGADGRVAQICQMVDLRPLPQRRLLEFHEVTDLGFRADVAGGSQMGKRPNRRAICNARTNEHAEVVDRHFVGQFRVGNAHIPVDFAG
jgi:hypothetical protein